MRKTRKDSLWSNHGEEILAMLREGVRIVTIAKRLQLQKATTQIAVERYFDAIGIADGSIHNRHVLFVLHDNPLRNENQVLRSQVESELCPFPDLPCDRKRKISA